MEPNKLEKDFRDKLEQRTIQPSEMAWDRLDAMLSVTENKKPKSDHRWIYMAASLLVFLLAGVLLLNMENENTVPENKNNVVVTEEQPTIEDSNTIIAPVTNPEALASSESPTLINEKQDSTVIIADNFQIAETVANDANDKTEPAIIPVNNVDQLLAVASKQNTTKKKSSVKVDPNALLSSVEEELDNSFKDRVLIGTVKNFKTVKTAVSNRNYQ